MENLVYLSLFFVFIYLAILTAKIRIFLKGMNTVIVSQQLVNNSAINNAKSINHILDILNSHKERLNNHDDILQSKNKKQVH